jgi:hypothetical protein
MDDIYRDCGKCPYLGGCINCNHPELRDALYKIKALEAEVERLRSSPSVAETIEKCAKWVESSYIADRVGTNQEFAAAIRWRTFFANRIRALAPPAKDTDHG